MSVWVRLQDEKIQQRFMVDVSAIRRSCRAISRHVVCSAQFDTARHPGILAEFVQVGVLSACASFY